MNRLDRYQDNLMQAAEECGTFDGKYSASILNNTFVCSEFYSQYISTPVFACRLSRELQVSNPASDKALIPRGNDAWNVVHFIYSVLLDLEQTKFGKEGIEATKSLW